MSKPEIKVPDLDEKSPIDEEEAGKVRGGLTRMDASLSLQTTIDRTSRTTTMLSNITKQTGETTNNLIDNLK